MRFMSALRPWLRSALPVVLLACAGTHAQTKYDRIDVGTQLDSKGIGLGLFAKPIPLPQGDWTVVGKHEQQLGLSGGPSDGPGSTPRVTLTLRNTAPQNTPVLALIVSFTPNSLPINWGNSPCSTNNPLGLVEDFGLKADAMVFACARADSVYNFRETLRDVQNSTNTWMKTYLSGLAPFADTLPSNVVFVDVYGNKFRGKTMAITFVLRADANADVNVAYRDHLKAWMLLTGQNWMKVLNNDSVQISGPDTYVANK